MCVCVKWRSFAYLMWCLLEVLVRGETRPIHSTPLFYPISKPHLFQERDFSPAQKSNPNPPPMHSCVVWQCLLVEQNLQGWGRALGSCLVCKAQSLALPLKGSQVEGSVIITWLGPGVPWTVWEDTADLDDQWSASCNPKGHCACPQRHTPFSLSFLTITASDLYQIWTLGFF